MERERDRIDERAPLTHAPTPIPTPAPAPTPHPFKSFTALSRVCIANSARGGVRGVGTAIGQRHSNQSMGTHTHTHTHTRRVPHKWLHKYLRNPFGQDWETVRKVESLGGGERDKTCEQLHRRMRCTNICQNSEKEGRRKAGKRRKG